MGDGMETVAGTCRPYTIRGTPMLLIADTDSAFDAAIPAAGGRLTQRVTWAGVADLLPRLAGWPVLAIEAIGVDADRLDDVLPLLAYHIDRTASQAVIAITEAQIDLVTRHLLGPDTRLLCLPTPAERIEALAAAAASPIPTLRTSVQDSRSGATDEQLRNLELRAAEIARLAADLSRDVRVGHDVADRRSLYGVEPIQPGTVSPAHGQEVRRMIAVRHKRHELFAKFGHETLFEDPAWDMLLDLYAAELEGKRVSVTSLCIAAGVAPTTALRWISKMTEMALLIRHPDLDDRRRAFMTLSPPASEAMRAYMMAAR